MRKKHFVIGSGIKAFVSMVLLLAVFSCESVLFIELEESEKLIVVNGALSSDSIASIQVSRTRHILDNAPVIPLENAIVKLHRNLSGVEQLTSVGQGFYISGGTIPVIGEEYFIEVENAGYPSVSASAVIPEPVEIVSLDTLTIEESDNPDYYYWSYYESLLQFDLTIHDPPGVDNYYLLSVQANRSRTEWRDTTVTIVDSLYYGNRWNYYPRDSTYLIGDIFRYIDNPYIVSEDIVVEAATSDGILFSDQLIDGKQYSFRGSMVTSALSSADYAVVEFRLHSISESYYKYLKSRQKHYDTKENYLAVPVIVYSNVESGTGFFGGFSTDVHTIITFIPEYGYDYWYNEKYPGFLPE